MDTVHSTAIIGITEEGMRLARRISEEIPADLHFRVQLSHCCDEACYFQSLPDTFAKLFSSYRAIIAVMAQGIVSRMIAPLICSKYTDPAIVCCDEVGRYAISALSGHEGGANRLAYLVSSVTGAEPVITTASDANRRYVVGIGARKGVSQHEVVSAITDATRLAGIAPNQIRCLTSAWVKKQEVGILQAAEALNLFTRFIPKHYYENPAYSFEPSKAKDHIGISAVAEPSALLTARNPELVLKKTTFGPVTIAIARENTLPDDEVCQ